MIQVVGDYVHFCAQGDQTITTAIMNRDFTGYTGPVTRFTGGGYVPPPYFQIADGKAYASFSDNGIPGVYTAEMDTDHTNWSHTLHPGPSGERHRAELHVVEDRIYYAYMAESGGIWNVYTARMNTDGTGWTTTQRTDYKITSEKRTEGHVRFKVAGNKAYYCWSYPDDSSIWQVWTAEMDLDGTNWVATQRTTGSPSKWRPELQVVGNKIYYTYWEGSSSWTSQDIVTAGSGANILSKSGSYGLGTNADFRVSAFVDNDWTEPLYNGQDNSSAGASVFASIDTAWTHLAMTYDRDEVRLYVNGELMGVTGLTDAMRTNAWDMMIGDDFEGAIDEVRICDRALNASEIRATYQLAAGTYYWRVSAEDGTEPPVFSETRSLTLAGPDIPLLLAPSDGVTLGTDAPEFVWSATAGSGGTYTFEYALDSQFTSGVVTVSGLSDTTYAPGSLADDTYYWHVAATDSEANGSGYQAHPFALTIMTGGGAPQITLVSPPDDSTTSNHGMELEVSAFDPEGSPLTIWIRGDTTAASDLLYHQENASSPADILYDWTAPVLQVEASTVGLWHLDENAGGVIGDATAYSHDGSISGATWTTGKFGYALDFDGDSDRVEIASTPELQIAGPMTIEAWVTMRSFNPGETGYNVIARKGGNGAINFILRAHDGAPSLQVNTDVDIYEAVGTQTDWSLDTWHYLAGVWDGSFARLYVDGQLIDSVAGAGTPLVDDTVFILGDRPMGGSYWDGLIDEVRYTNGAKTAAEIASTYHLDYGTYSWQVIASDGIKSDTSDVRSFVVQLPGITPPVITLNAPADGALFPPDTPVVLDVTVSDPDLSPVEVWIYGDSSATPATLLYHGADLASPADILYTWGGGYEAEFPATSNTVALWHFNENSGTTAFDATGNHDGAVMNATWAPGRFGSALTYGDTDRVEIPDHPDFNTPEVTIQAWVNASAFTSTYNCIVSKGSYPSPLDLGYALLTHDAQLVFLIGNADGSNWAVLQDAMGGTTLDTNTWYYVAVTYDGSEVRLYVNGDLDSNGTANPYAYTAGLHYATGPLDIGSSLQQASADTWIGLIDEVRILNVALSESEIRSTYALEAGRYYWYVEAEDTLGILAGSATRYFDVGLPPDLPVLLNPPDLSLSTDNTPTFDWTTTAPPGGRYTLQLALDSTFTTGVQSFGSISDTTYTIGDPDALSDARYYWHVQAHTAGSDSSGYQAVPFRFTVDAGAPAVPTLIHPADLAVTNDDTPTFDWSATAGPGGTYRLEYTLDAAFTTGVVTVSGLTDTTHSIAAVDALADDIYYWHVEAMDEATNGSGYQTTPNTFTVDTEAPDVPTLINPPHLATIGDNTPTFDWSATTGSGGTYTLQLASDSDFTFAMTVGGLEDTTYQESTPLMDGVYYWHVKARDAAGNESEYQSAAFMFTVDMGGAPAIPDLVAPPDSSFTCDTTPSFAWSSVVPVALSARGTRGVISASGAAPAVITYTLQYASDPTFADATTVADLDATAYTVPETASLAYPTCYWRVEAVDGGDHSGYQSQPFRFGYFVAGDQNGDGAVTAADVISLVNYVFKSGVLPVPCEAAGDVNCDGVVASSDIIYLVNYTFKAGPPPCNVGALIASGVWSCP